MPEETRESDGQLKHPSVRYEKTDASRSWILTLIACTIAFGALIHGLVWVFFVNTSDRLADERKSTYPLATSEASTLPRQPRLEQLDRLEGNPDVDVYARQKAKEDVLRSYGATAEPGFVRIPIDEAMKQLAGRLPVRKTQPAGPAHDLGLVDAGEPNSGRLFRKEPR